MHARQKGITFIGWLFLLLPVAIVGYAAIRLTPVYLNYIKVSKSMQQVAAEHAGDSQINPAAVRVELTKRFDIEGIEYPPIDTVEIRRDNEIWGIYSKYEDEVPLFGGISLLVKFDKRAKID
ncbi:MAG: DUF4845 domain-containing protein [Mycobacterium sp.]